VRPPSLEEAALLFVAVAGMTYLLGMIVVLVMRITRD
jgi:hypothetical protein